MHMFINTAVNGYRKNDILTDRVEKQEKNRALILHKQIKNNSIITDLIWHNN